MERAIRRVLPQIEIGCVVIGIACSPRPEPAQSTLVSDGRGRVADERPRPERGLDVGRVDTVRIVLQPPSKQARFRWEVETLGLVTVLTELGLSDLPGVVVEVAGCTRAPGTADLLPIAQEWTAELDLGSDPESLIVRIRLCDPSGACEAFEATATRAHPEGAMPTLLGASARRLGIVPPVGAAGPWGAPLSSDDYAVLLAGRSAASFYGLREPVDPSERGDRVRDPVARAVYIDPSVAVAQWVAGRRAAADGDWARARVFFTAAALGRSTSPQLAADEAAAYVLVGNAGAATAAWDALLEQRPGDPRFLLPQARALLAAGAVGEAAGRVEALAVEYADEPAVAELRVRVADRTPESEDMDPLLAAWQAVDDATAEPVFRRIHLRARSGRYDEALTLVDELKRRGRTIEADQLRMAMAVGLSRWDDAADAAEALGDPATAARIRGRGARAAGHPLPPALRDDPDPGVRLIVGQSMLDAGDATGALARAAGVLKVEPWQPEALALRARALRALGRVAEAEAVERVLADVEPGA